jgi:hypothetical protein
MCLEMHNEVCVMFQIFMTLIVVWQSCIPLSCQTDRDVKPINQTSQLLQLKNMCGTLRKTLLAEMQMRSVFGFCEVIAMPTLLSGSQCWMLTRWQTNRNRSSTDEFTESNGWIATAFSTRP